MRKLFIALTVFSFSFMSCQKEDAQSPGSPDASGKKYLVELNLPDFVQDIENLKKSARTAGGTNMKDSTLGEKVVYIEYRAFSGNIVASSISQNKFVNPTEFGSIRDSLAAGTYTVYLLASKISMNLLMDRYLNFWNDDFEIITDDTYTKKLTIQVTPGGSTIVNDITLDRALGKVELRLMDGQEIENMQRDVSVEIFPANYQIDLSNGNSQRGEMDFFSQYLNRPTYNNYQLYEGYVVPNSETFLKITMKDRNVDTIISIRQIPLVIERNKKTIITGYLLGNPTGPNTKFDIMLNQVWDDETEIEL